MLYTRNLEIERIERLLHVGHWRLDTINNELHWSDEIYAIHGVSSSIYTPDVHSAIDFYTPEDRALVSSCIERAIERQESFMFQARLVHGDGSIKRVLCKGEVEKNTRGNVTAVFGTIQDITEYIEEQEHYEQAVLNANVAIWDWDLLRDRITWLGSAHETLGFENKNELPTNPSDFFSKLIHENDELNLKQAIDAHLNKKTEIDLDIRIKKPDGKFIWVTARAFSKQNTQDQAMNLSGSFTNINKLKRVEEKLVHSNDDLEKFASVAAHDLQQPLRTISSFLEIIEDKYAPQLDDKGKQYMQLVVNSAQSMSYLVNDLLEYSRLGTNEIEKVPTDTNELLEKVTNMLTQIIDESGAKITYKDLPTIKCDPLKIERILINLIENAIRYQKENTKPSITITCKKISNMWVFLIKDNGTGIPKEHQAKVFDMFERLRNENKHKGTGIGLSICKKIVELHGGNIWVESKLDQGSVFHFEIPA